MLMSGGPDEMSCERFGKINSVASRDSVVFARRRLRELIDAGILSHLGKSVLNENLRVDTPSSYTVDE